MGKTFENLFKAALSQEEQNQAALAAVLEPIKENTLDEPEGLKIEISARSMRSPMTGLAALLAIAALVVFIVFQTNDIQKVLAYRELERGISRADLPTVDRALDEIFNNLKIVNWVNTSIFDVPETDPFQVAGSRELYEMYAAVYQGKMDQALTRFEAMNQFQLLRILTANGEKKGTEILAALETSFANYKSSREQIAEAQQSLAALSAQSAKARDQFNLLLRDFGDLFSLDTKRDKGDDEKQATFYERGVLEGMPAITQLPDDIPDLVALKQELDRAGGEVGISGEGAHQQFVAKIDGLRDGFKRLRDDLDGADQKYLDGQAEIERLRTKSFEERQFVLNQLRLSLTAAAEPEVGKMAKSLAVLFVSE